MSNSQNYRCWGTSQRAGHSGLRYPLGFLRKTDKNIELEEVDVEIAAKRVPPPSGDNQALCEDMPLCGCPPLKGY